MSEREDLQRELDRQLDWISPAEAGHYTQTISPTPSVTEMRNERDKNTGTGEGVMGQYYNQRKAFLNMVSQDRIDQEQICFLLETIAKLPDVCFVLGFEDGTWSSMIQIKGDENKLYEAEDESLHKALSQSYRNYQQGKASQ